jgi:hypothetical protein
MDLTEIWGPVVGRCEHGNESLSSIVGGKFLYQVSDSQVHKDSLLNGIS